MKKLFVAFEGLDGSGKTSLAKEVAKLFKVSYTHNDKCLSYEDGKEKSYKYIEDLKNIEPGVIDRLVHTGEAIYAPIYRDYDGSDYFEDLEDKMMQEHNILIVYVEADEDTIKERLAKRGEDYINLDDLSKIKENYEKFLENTKIPVIRYNNSKLDIESGAYILSLGIASKINREFNK